MDDYDILLLVLVHNRSTGHATHPPLPSSPPLSPPLPTAEHVKAGPGQPLDAEGAGDAGDDPRGRRGHPGVLDSELRVSLSAGAICQSVVQASRQAYTQTHTHTRYMYMRVYIYIYI